MPPLEIVDLTMRVGFPIAVAWFLLYRLNGKLEKFSNNMLLTTQLLRDIIQSLKEHDERAREAITQIEKIEESDRNY